MIENGDGKFWLTYGHVGIKVFPRVASTTLRETYGHYSTRAEFMSKQRKAVIVRHPEARVFSFWAGLAKAQSDRYPGMPMGIKDVDFFIDWLVRHNKNRMDWHIRPMTNQLMGFLPQDRELWTLDAWMAEPGYGLPKPTAKHHLTPSEHRALMQAEWDEMDPDLHARFLDFYKDDIALFERAQKSPA